MNEETGKHLVVYINPKEVVWFSCEQMEAGMELYVASKGSTVSTRFYFEGVKSLRMSDMNTGLLEVSATPKGETV